MKVRQDCYSFGFWRPCLFAADYQMKGQQMETYSVLMSVYAKEKPDYLDQSLQSMVSQTVKPDEIVLVEDGPLHEGLYRIIEKYKQNYPELMTVIRIPVNGGLGNALNHGLKAARNELIARMDSDDISLPKRCEMQLKAFEKNPELSIVGTQMIEFIKEPENIISFRSVPSSYRNILKFSRRRSPFNHPTVMFRKSAVENAGGYKTFGRKEDLELFIRMGNEGYKAINLKKPYLLYRTGQENLKRRKDWINCKEYIQIMYAFHRKGWNGLTDITYVVTGQLVMHFAPYRIVKRLSDIFLRSKADKNAIEKNIK